MSTVVGTQSQCHGIAAVTKMAKNQMRRFQLDNQRVKII